MGSITENETRFPERELTVLSLLALMFFAFRVGLESFQGRMGLVPTVALCLLELAVVCAMMLIKNRSPVWPLATLAFYFLHGLAFVWGGLLTNNLDLASLLFWSLFICLMPLTYGSNRLSANRRL